MDEEPIEKFNYKKLIQWFLMNIKTFNHIDRNEADDEWFNDSPMAMRRNNSKNFLSPAQNAR